jgi:hypothetical protein
VFDELEQQVKRPLINRGVDSVTAGLVAELGLTQVWFHKQADYIIPEGITSRRG